MSAERFATVGDADLLPLDGDFGTPAVVAIASEFVRLGLIGSPSGPKLASWNDRQQLKDQATICSGVLDDQQVGRQRVRDALTAAAESTEPCPDLTIGASR